MDFRKKELEAYHIEVLVRNFYDSGVEIRNASNAFQDSGIIAVICFFYRGTDGTQSLMDGPRSPLPLNRQANVGAPSPYVSPEQVQMLFECQRIFLHYGRTQGIPKLKFVAAEAMGMEGLCEIVLSEAGGASRGLFVPPGEPFNVRVQVSPNGGDCEVHWNWPVVGGNYVNGFIVSLAADSDDWKSIQVDSSPARILGLVPGQIYRFMVSALSRIGIGPPSPIVTSGTPPIQHLSQYTRNPTSASVQQVSLADLGQDRADSDDWKSIQVDSSPARILGLVPGHIYRFMVSALSRIGIGPPSPIVTSGTPPIQHLSQYTRNPTSASVQQVSLADLGQDRGKRKLRRFVTKMRRWFRKSTTSREGFTITRTGTFREKEKTAGENKKLEERKKTTTTRRKDSTTDEEEERETKEKEAQEQRKQRLRKNLLDAIVAKEDLRADIEELSATLKSTAKEIRGILQEDEQLLVTNGAVSLNVTLTICRGVHHFLDDLGLHRPADLCREYNVGHGCSRGDECLKLHICAGYIAGTCEECKLNHDVFGVEIRNASNAFQDSGITAVICFFYRGTDGTKSLMDGPRSPLPLNRQANVGAPSPYESPEQVQMLFECQRIFLHYRRTQGIPKLKFVAAEAVGMEGLCEIVLSEAGGASRGVFVPPGEPFNVRVQVSPNGGDCEVHWNWPVVGGNYVNGFIVSLAADSDDWKSIQVDSSPVRILGLVPGQIYRFMVCALSRIGTGPPSPIVTSGTPPIQHLSQYTRNPTSASVQQVSLADLGQDRGGLEYATSDRQDARQLVAGRIGPLRRPAEYLMQKATLTRNGLYQVPVEDIMRDPDERTAKCRLSFDSTYEDMEERVIILLGATGAGKSTLVNGFVNNFYGVELEDPFRLVLIPDTESGKPKVQSQTSWVTAYTLPWQEGCRASFNLTIVDTPGFGDMRGLLGDKSVMTRLMKLFSKGNSEGLDHLDAVGFVLQASNTSLTLIEKYAFDSVQSVFGKDVINNIFLMITFAGRKIPPVVKAVWEGSIPFVDFFRFNFSTLFASNDAKDSEDHRFAATSWRSSSRSFSNFLAKFQESKPLRLQLSMRVLKRRDAIGKKIVTSHDRIDDETKTLEDLKRSYGKAISGKMFTESSKASPEKHTAIRSEVTNLVLEAHENLCELEKISPMPNRTTAADYVELLISAENHQMKPGWTDRIRILQDVRIQEQDRSAANFYGVELEDPFRLVLIPDTESGKPKVQSQTSWVTAYTLPWQEGCRASFNLTIVDTPGFGDMRGLMGDKCVMTRLMKLFSKGKSEGLDHLDAVGFVLQASNTSLTLIEKYAFDSVQSVFGKDVINNIFLMITFADRKFPLVLEAFREGNIPFVDFFRFNFSSLFASNDAKNFEDYHEFAATSWRSSSRSFSNFLAKFQESKPLRLQLSMRVLKRRDAIGKKIVTSHDRIDDALLALSSIKNETVPLERRKDETSSKRNFPSQAQVTKQRRVELRVGEYATNCMRCNFTCHYPCTISKEGQMGACDVINPETGYCRVCPSKCHFREHVNSGHRFESYNVTESKTLEDLKRSSGKAIPGKTFTESSKASPEKHTAIRSEVTDLVREAHKNLCELEKISHMPNRTTAADYVELLISAENHQMKPGWTDRIRIKTSASWKRSPPCRTARRPPTTWNS
ncbi:unnamed protein product [Darwinula stevensoni]|uniref:Fibronectin type-III domain-containing protein n=1 Tax=Darwinula stevensoni TaxID=69355 RepID=A0A7R9FSK7_9CRUS|nr:unnamed protein product [Darwinula stevensoni]CAG0903961.1 unnamed protein product [Darwinula stevensoni]